MSSRKKNVYLAWSSGKDSAWALWTLRQQKDIEVVGLFTTINTKSRRVFMHAVRQELVEAQARAIALPLILLPITDCPSNEEYDRVMSGFLRQAKRDRVDCVAFGDLFLEDVRRYREDRMKECGVTPIFPLWGIPTRELARDMIQGGLKSIITSVDTDQISSSFAGRYFDQNLLDELPANADPCGENGEFHSFVFDGPHFQSPLLCNIGEIVVRKPFVFADVKLR